MTQFGAEFKTVTPGDFTFTLFDDGQQVDVVTISAGQTGQVYNFHAFEDNSAFDQVIVQGPGANSNNGAVIMDNLRYGLVSVPEPSTLLVLAGMCIMGLAGAAWCRRLTVAR